MSSKELTYIVKANVYNFAMTYYKIIIWKFSFSKHLPQHLVNEMVMKGEKPKLPPHFKITWLPTFIQKCWQTKAQDRPTFETICSNLQ